MSQENTSNPPRELTENQIKLYDEEVFEHYENFYNEREGIYCAYHILIESAEEVEKIHKLEKVYYNSPEGKEYLEKFHGKAEWIRKHYYDTNHKV